MKNTFRIAFGFALVVMMLAACRSEILLIPTSSPPPPAATATKLPPTMPPVATQTATVTPIPPTQTATATPTPVLKLIYVRSWKDINIYDFDTNETLPLIQNMDKIGQWSLSPDKKSLIYQLQISSDAPPDAMIYLLDLTTKQVRSSIPYSLAYVWHPSGKAILGLNNNTGQYDLFRFDDGVVVGHLPYGTFSPDGTKLAAIEGQNLRIYSIILDTDGQVTGIDETYLESKLELGENISPWEMIWSPAGDRLAFGATRRYEYPTSYFFAVNPDGSELIQIADSTTLEPGVLLNIYSNGVNNFSWSPDGSKIAFIAHTFVPESKSTIDPQVYIVSADGENPSKITGDGLFPIYSSPLLFLDGQLLVGSDASGLDIYSLVSYSLVMINLENGERNVLYENVPNYYYLDFLYPQEEESLTGILTEPFAFTCATGWTRLEIGKEAIVAPGSPNRVRSEPMKGDNIVTKIPAGTVVSVIDGPVCADGLVFWKVEGESIPGGSGWTAEGDGVEYWLSPLE